MSACISLFRNLQIIYTDCHNQIPPIINESLGSIPKSLNGYACQLGFNNLKGKIVKQKLQSVSATCTAKICKNFLKCVLVLLRKKNQV